MNQTVKKKSTRREKLAKAAVVCLGVVLAGWLLSRAAWVREAGVRLLGKVGKPALPLLRRALRDDDTLVRQAAREGLAQVGEAAVPPLVESLGDRDPEVRAQSALALTVL